MSVGPGELVCVVGRVGSGKSSLIGALLGNALDPADAVISTLCMSGVCLATGVHHGCMNKMLKLFSVVCLILKQSRRQFKRMGMHET